jgi:hypothetical protein
MEEQEVAEIGTLGIKSTAITPAIWYSIYCSLIVLRRERTIFIEADRGFVLSFRVTVISFHVAFNFSFFSFQ